MSSMKKQLCKANPDQMIGYRNQSGENALEGKLPTDRDRLPAS
jgi:hypothetical protein